MPLHPHFAELARAMAENPNHRPTHRMSPAEAREGYRALGLMFGPGQDVAAVDNRSVAGPGGDIPLRIYSPGGDGPFGVWVFYHGGGWVIGDLDTHDRECRAICNGAGCIVVSVDYRLAPEHPFPAAPEDAYAALCWVGEHAAELGGDAGRIAVGGDSAGGNLAAVVALLSRDRGGPALRHQLLVYPATDMRGGDAYPSLVENAAGPFLERETMDYFRGHYFGDGAADAVANDVRASPLLAESHADLPPALIVTAQFDPLRDEGEAYAERLRGAGVEVTLHRYDSMPHIFFQLSPLIAEGQQLLDEAAAAVRAALG